MNTFNLNFPWKEMTIGVRRSICERVRAVQQCVVSGKRKHAGIIFLSATGIAGTAGTVSFLYAN
jgi:hypothetical protein